MSDFPSIESGMEWNETSARQWRNLTEYAQRLVDALGITPAGRIANPALTFNLRRRRRVAIVETVDPRERSYLGVRSVRYATQPPRDGEYEWAGPTFEAYPEIGFTLEDYAALLWAEALPTIDTPIIDIHWQDGHWLAGMEVGTEKLIVVRAFKTGDDGEPDPGSRFLVVQEVRPVIVQGVWNGTYEAFGETSEVNVWPEMTAGQYRPFLWEPMALQEKTTVMPLVRIGSVWYVKQRPKFNIERPTGTIKQMDCSAIE